MTKLEEMWTALEKYQPYAEANNHGESWALMCTLRTPEAYNAAYWGAYHVVKGAADGSHVAVSVARAAYNAVEEAARAIEAADEHAQKASDRINGVIRLKEEGNG